jgi:hypothetical protein
LLRILFNAATLLSLLLLVAIAALWIRSHWVEDRIDWRRRDGLRALHTAPGHLVLALDLANWSGQPPDYYGVKYTSEAPTPVETDILSMFVLSIGPRDTFVTWNRAGFGWYLWRSASPGGASIARLVVPLWSLAVAGALLPVFWLGMKHHARVRRRRRSGLCPHCGYDLRATPERCPECGMVTSA